VAIEPSADSHTVKVFQVNEEDDVLVLSMQEGASWATEGATVLLAAEDDTPVATVQLTELDEAGFAIAQITHRTSPPSSIRKGDLFSARPLPNR